MAWPGLAGDNACVVILRGDLRGGTKAFNRKESAVKNNRGSATYPSQISDPATWVDQHGDHLFRYSLMRVRSRESAENLVQETFLAALTSRHTFSGRSSEKTWMIGILKHKIIDQFRKSLREKSITELQHDDEQTIDGFYDVVGHPKQFPKDWMPDPQALLHAKEFWSVLRTCLSCLPARAANAFIMREFDDLSTEDICKKLDITPTNLWVTLHRVRLQLRGLLEENWFEKGAVR